MNEDILNLGKTHELVKRVKTGILQRSIFQC